MCIGPLRLRASVLSMGVVCVIGCGVAAPAPTVLSVKPARSYTDRVLRLTIEGAGFIPTFQIDEGSGVRRGNVEQFSGRVGSGTEPVLLHDFDWVDADTLTATMDPDLPFGPHAVEVIDPRGQSAEKKNAFFSAGADLIPPTVTFDRPAPGTPVGPGTVLDVSVTASDADPGTLASLTLEMVIAGQPLPVSQDCPLEAEDTQGRCDVQITVPTSLSPGDQFALHAVAKDTARDQHLAQQWLTFTVEGPPTIASLSPSMGGIAGGTDLVVTGTGFHPGTQVYLGDLLILPQGGTVVDAQTIVGRAPTHLEGMVDVVARTPIGQAQLTDAYRYLPPPQITSILPELGNPEGGTMIRVRGSNFTSRTQIFFGDTLVGAEPCESQTRTDDTEITGVAPAGMGHTSVWAMDPDLGWTRLPDGFGWSAMP